MLVMQLDLVGSNPANIQTTNHKIMENVPSNQGQVIIGGFGVMHSDPVVVHIETGSTLVKDQDYYLTYFSRHLKANFNIDGFAGIVIVNKTLTGNVKITGKYVGGGYVKFNPTHVIELINLVGGRPEHVEWDNVLDAPAAVNPTSHRMPAESIAVGYADYVAVLFNIATSIKNLAESNIHAKIPIGGKIEVVRTNNNLNPKYWLPADGATINRSDYPDFFHVLEIVGDTFVMPIANLTYVRMR